MARKIICTNEDGISCTFSDKFEPFLLESVAGLYDVVNELSFSNSGLSDVDTFLGSKAKIRDIKLTIRDGLNSDHQANRDFLNKLFKNKSLGTLRHVENGISKDISYRVERITPGTEERARRITVDLRCENPYFRDISTKIVFVSEWRGAFKFKHIFKKEGEKFGYKNNTLLAQIYNESNISIGLTITLYITGDVINPVVRHAEAAKHIKLGDTSYSLNLKKDDEIRITTGRNNKHVYLIRGGKTSEINQYVIEGSEFIQLNSGLNTIGYTADSGAKNMSLKIEYKNLYAGC